MTAYPAASAARPSPQPAALGHSLDEALPSYQTVPGQPPSFLTAPLSRGNRSVSATSDPSSLVAPPRDAKALIDAPTGAAQSAVELAFVDAGLPLSALSECGPQPRYSKLPSDLETRNEDDVDERLNETAACRQTPSAISLRTLPVPRMGGPSWFANPSTVRTATVGSERFFTAREVPAAVDETPTRPLRRFFTEEEEVRSSSAASLPSSWPAG